MKLLTYWKYLKLKSLFSPGGIKLIIALNWKCTLNCDCCVLKDGGNKRPVDGELKNAAYWIDFIETFPVKVREVILTGGEPTIHKSLPFLVTYLLDTGYFVQVQTNLTNIEPLLKIKPQLRLKLVVTYHEQYNMNKFLNNLETIRKMGYQIRVDEIQNGHIKNSNVKAKLDRIQDYPEKNIVRVDSSGRIFVNAKEMIEANMK